TLLKNNRQVARSARRCRGSKMDVARGDRDAVSLVVADNQMARIINGFKNAAQHAIAALHCNLRADAGGAAAPLPDDRGGAFTVVPCLVALDPAFRQRLEDG